ncbi:MAG: hypothetical protein IKU85_01470 [Bacteroidaceae bacterium]|nr:hypothetical protein [Bacteroidaceae bacterium]
MKIFKLMAIALVAMCGLNSCSEDCDHNFIEHDFTQELVGTWTTLSGELAEVMVIKADGSFTTTGIMKGGSLYEEKGTIKVVNNKVTLAFDGDKETFEGRLEFVAGKSLSLVMFNDNDARLTYDYCENDLADEVVGMWVCTYVSWMDADMAVNVYQADGKALFTGFVGNADFDYASNVETTYKVIGDLMIQSNPMSYEGAPEYLAFRLDYSPNGSEYGDVLTNTNVMALGDETIETTASMIRIKQSLDLANKSYDYNNLYLSNVKGKDQDINFMGYTMNLATMDGTGLDKMLKAILFHIEFPNANTISYTYNMGNNQESFSAPIKVEGNKLTVKMSDKVSTLKDIVYYAYQDADDSQMHLYMHRNAFVNFYTNVQALLLEGTDAQFDITNAEAIDAIYNSINDVVESINLSIVMK